MKRVLLTFLLFTGSFQFINAQTYSWAKGMGGSVGDDAARASCVDASGNIIIAGSFANTIEFVPGGAASFTSVGGFDVFVAKYDATGNYLWGKTFGGTGTGAPATLDDYAYAVQADAGGNVYVTGFFQNTVDFDPSNPGINVLTSVGLGDMYIVKYDAFGNFLWVKQIGGVSQQIGYGLKLDAAGNIFICGALIGASDFDPDPINVALLTGYSTGYDAYLAKYDSNGNYLWANKFGSTSSNSTDNFWNLDVDILGHVYAIGYFGGTVDFNPGPTTAYLTASSTDMVIATFDNDGNYLRAFKLGGAGADFGRCIKADNAGSFYITGYYASSSVDFDPGAGVTSLTSSNNDIFVAKYDTTSSFAWVRRIGGPGQDHGWQLDVDNNSNVYLTGYFFSSTLSIFGSSGTGIGIATLSNAGGVSSGTGGTSDAFLIKYDNTGTYQYSYDIGGSGSTNDAGYCITIDPTTSDIYAAGSFSASVDFDFDASNNSLTSNGGTDIYLAKYSTTPLAVQMSELFGNKNNNKAILKWQTYTEINNKGFDIERSADGNSFDKIGFIAGQGNGSFEITKDYEFADQRPLSKQNFYRLKQIDLSGKITYSNTILLRDAANEHVTGPIYPNPAKNILNLAITSSTTELVKLSIYDITGNSILQQENTIQGNAVIKMDISGLAAGLYNVHVLRGTAEDVLQFVK